MIPAPGAAPQESVFSSVKQAFKEDFDHEVIRGHFDVGSPPDARRYYCLVDEKKGRRQPNAVSGQPVPRNDGMTGLKANAVSVYTCASAEQQGLLVTDGYLLAGGATAGGTASAITAASPPPKPMPMPMPTPAPTPAGGVPTSPESPVKPDVAGVKLGMSVDEIRAILKSKKLRDYYESTDSLSHGDAGGTYVNVIAGWTPAPVGGAADAESYEIMFTPVPGKERAMAVVHAVAYSANNAVRETVLDAGLVKKYGGFAAADDMPASPTWRFQSGGAVQVGDSCNRRGIVGGRGPFDPGKTSRPNLSLQTEPREARFEIEHCGITIVTEDHSVANGGAPRADRMVTRFTVSAYSPSIALDGANAAALFIQSNAGRAKDQPPPNL